MVVNEAHFHLVLNHFPILGAIFAIPLLAYGFFRKNTSLERAGLLFLLFVGIVSVLTYLSGESAEEIVEKLSGVSDVYIEKHEEIAGVAVAVALITSLVSLIALFLSLKNSPLRRAFTGIALLLAFLTSGVMVLTANYGGKIRHSEIRDGIQLQKAPYEDEREDGD